MERGGVSSFVSFDGRNGHSESSSLLRLIWLARVEDRDNTKKKVSLTELVVEALDEDEEDEEVMELLRDCEEKERETKESRQIEM